MTSAFKGYALLSGLILLSLLTTLNLYSGENLLFRPLSAHIFEPRAGTSYQFDNNKLRLDIGASFDLLRSSVTEKDSLSFGADFFTYSLLRSEGKLKFPVETADYFFGINAGYIYKLKNLELQTRLRVSHISSHLVDGYSDNGVFRQEPYIYSREFIDLTQAFQIDYLRLYAGAEIVFSSIPRDVTNLIPHVGIEYSYPLTGNIELDCGYDFKQNGYVEKHFILNEMTKIKYKPMHSFEAGFILRFFRQFGLKIYYLYYSGQNYHGMFIFNDNEYSAVGFRIIYY